MYYELKHEDFQKALNSKFEILGFDNKFEVELVEITEKKIYSEHEAFSLFFKSTKEFLLAQQIYRMKNENLGEGELFIVPVEEKENGFLYQAVFNRKIAA